MALQAELRAELDGLVKQNKVVLFLKGTRGRPQCGFSASVVDLLDQVLDDYATVDVLARPDVRDGIKEYSDWPTIPQLYIGGEFVGGADIVKEMFESGELKKQLGVPEGAEPKGRSSPLVGARPTAPRLTLTEAAVEAVSAARGEDDGPYLRLEISADFDHALFFDDKHADDLEVASAGVTVVVDPDTARRANDVHVDYVRDGEREGFKIDNPNRGKAQAGAPAASTPPAAPAKPPRPSRPPEVVVTDAAQQQFAAALEEEEGGEHAIKVGARRMGATKVDYDLGIISLDEKGAEDFELDVAGLRFFIDPNSARTLDGAVIDFIDGGGGSGFKFTNARIEKGWEDPRAAELQSLIEREVNPSIAAHGGYVELLDLTGDNAYVVMGGGCQGCGMAAVTMQQGIQERVSRAMPGLHLIDTTDHASGTNPYYQAGK